VVLSPGRKQRDLGVSPIPCVHPLPKSPLRASVKMAFLVARIGAQLERPLRASESETTLACIRFQSHYKLTFGSEHPKLGFLLPGQNHTSMVSVFNPCLWWGIQSTGTVPHETWTLTVLVVRAILCCKNAVVKTKVRIQMLVFSDSENGCTQGSGNGCEQGTEQIPDARNLHPGCTQPL